MLLTCVLKILGGDNTQTKMFWDKTTPFPQKCLK